MAVTVEEGSVERSKRGFVPTIQNVANLADVSTATVSRVINQPNCVSLKLRKKVEAVLISTGYVRDGVAGALASSKSQTVGILIPTLNNTIFARGVNAIEERFSQRGYNTFIAANNYDLARESEQVRKLLERGVDGMVLFGLVHKPETIDLLARHQCPFVTTWAYSQNSEVPCVGFDNFKAVGQVAGHLVALGHTSIGMIAGITEHNDRARDRLAGFGEALQQNGLVLDAQMVVEMPYEVNAGREGLRKLLETKKNCLTAVFCGNDVLAVGALIEARSTGIRVPQDLSIVGFDDLELAQYVTPSLTTVHVPAVEMGRVTADYVLRQLSGEDNIDNVEISTHLKKRDSTSQVNIRADR